MRKIIFAAIFSIFFVGCSPHHAMRPVDMYLAPAPPDKALKSVVVFISKINREMDVAEGWIGGISWNRLIIAPDGKVTETLALNLEFPGECAHRLITVMPVSTKEELKGYVTVIASHDGEVVYNQAGKKLALKNPLKEIKREEVVNFSPPLTGSEGFLYEVSTDSQEFKDLLALFTHYRIKEVDIIRRYKVTKYGSQLSQKELEEIEESDSLVKSLREWLLEDWVIPFGVPLMGPEAMAFGIGAYKAFRLPSSLAKKIDLPGYRKYIMTAESSAEQFFYGLERYGNCRYELKKTGK